MQKKPSAPSCERNHEPILNVLQTCFTNVSNVFEIGSGSGEHGVFFAERMPWLNWQCSDLAENLAGIAMWVDEAKLSNLPKPIEMDVSNLNISIRLLRGLQ